MSRTSGRNHLFGIEIDEVSSVDRPASQLGLIAIAKAAGREDGMADENEGQMAFDIPADVAHGDTVVAEDGSEYVYLEVDEDGNPLELEGVDTAALLEGSDEVYDLSGADEEDEALDYADPATVGKAALDVLGQARKLGAAGVKYAKQNPAKAAAAAGAAGLAGGGAYMVAKKSAGTSVLEELSKAVTEEDRNRIVAKMAEDQDRLGRENDELRKAFEDERDARLTEAFIAKAAEYELPVEPEVFGPILKAIVEVLDEDEINVLDTVLASKGVAMDELGFTGGASNSGVLDEVSGLAAELVGKAAGGVTTEQATTALFEHNPGAYDAYLAEQMGR